MLITGGPVKKLLVCRDCEQGGWRGGEGAGARAFGRGVKVLCVDAIAYRVCSLRATLTVGTAGALGPSTVSDQYE